MAAPAASPGEWEAIITSFIRDHVRRAGADGVVVGLSGGLDSAVAAALAVKALGADQVHPVLMPAGDSDPDDEAHGRLVCDGLGIIPTVRPIAGAFEAMLGVLGGSAAGTAGTAPRDGNLKARLRMVVLYAEAATRGALVLGTGNKSELLTGYFTKFGDGGNDLQPIGDLYKTQVRVLAGILGVPAPIIDKPPSAGLWPGQTDEDELGLPYEDLDRVLKGIELDRPARAIAARTGIDIADVERIWALVRRTEHKRRPPLVPKVGARTVGIDWRRPVHWDAPP